MYKCLNCNNYDICNKKNADIKDCEFYVTKKNKEKIVKLGIKTNSVIRKIYESFL